MPERPAWFNPIVSSFTNKKLPAFFEFAKDKEISQVEERNESFVNKLFKIIPNKPLNMTRLKIDKPNYMDMMSNVNVKCADDVSELYSVVSKEYSFQVNMKDEYIDNLHYLADKIRKKFSDLGYSDDEITNMLVEKIYGHNSRRKQLLWFLYGNNILENLRKNISIKKTKTIQCVDCGEWIEIDINSKRIRCDCCRKKERSVSASLSRKKKMLTS